MNNNHINQSGNIHMVDITEKEITLREAKAQGFISINNEALLSIIDLNNKKGDVLNTARIAGINAVKQTSILIPLAHNILINSVSVDFRIDTEQSEIYSTVTVKSQGKTGVEIESLIGVEISLMTIYDMCKYLDRSMIINDVKLISKTGGKSGDFIREKND
tara:strand:+ start:2517 stop:2999 length:483 start_codon:yes stop_codon:yes gene_type:complete